MKRTSPHLSLVLSTALCSLAAALAASAAPPLITLAPLSSLRTTPRNNGAVPPVLSPPGASIVLAHDAPRQRLLVVNQASNRVDVIGITDPSAPVVQASLDMTPYGPFATSVAVHDDLLAVAVTGAAVTDPGSVVFFDADFQHLATVPVGPLPDMITFTPSGRYLLVANEGEATADYSIDPEGSISRIDVQNGFQAETIGFAGFNSQAAVLRASGVRIFGPGATVAQDLEPEWIAVSQDSKTAWVTLQENNAVAILDINAGTVTSIRALGTKDHGLAINAFDPSDRDSATGSGSIKIGTWPVEGLYEPDSIEAVRIKGKDYLVIANEGSARDAAGPGNEAGRLATLTLDPVRFPNALDLKKNANLGRLNVSKATGDTDGDGDIDSIQGFGSRSFSILDASGAMIWDSGSQFETILAALYPLNFNCSNSNNTLDDRSDDKGPEPEGVALGKAFGRDYAFISLERIGGFFVYDISTPAAPEFVQYVNNRDFTVAPALDTAGDLGAEGTAFIKADDSPNGSPLLVVANEVSGTTTIFEVVKQP